MEGVEKYRQELNKVERELDHIDKQIDELNRSRGLLTQKKKSLQRRLDSCLGPSVNSGLDQEEWMRNDFEWSQRATDALKKVFKMEKFRSVQSASINASMSGRDCIVIMPTGGGKSLCFQLLAVISKGFTLVISPLVSLMEDQLMKLSSLNIDSATISASTAKEEVSSILKKMTDPKSSLKLLYVTPERLAKSNRFMNKLEKASELGLLTRIAVDEVHCCSHWGHDFRPDYKFLSVLKTQFPNTPILGLTATASSDVIEDVKKMLSIPNALVLRTPLNRPNLFYEVYKKSSSSAEVIDGLHRLISNEFKGQTGVVYCLTQKDAEEVTSELKKKGIKAGCYHANMDAQKRSRVHTSWTENSLQVVVATVAFGMGIDKANVRFVIHHSISKSMENYYQESGRAGRDDEKARCILLAGFSDIFRQSTMVFTEKTGLEKLYGMVSYAFSNTECRRSLIAFHFGEGWNDSECQSMCDHCSETSVAGKRNVTAELTEFLKILEKGEELKMRVTALKLIDAWLGKGSAGLRVGDKKSKAKRTREEGEQLVINFLLEGYLKESFHFTPYSTISYIVQGINSVGITQDKIIEMNFKTVGNVGKSNGPKRKEMMGELIDSDNDDDDDDDVRECSPPAKIKKTKPGIVAYEPDILTESSGQV